MKFGLGSNVLGSSHSLKALNRAQPKISGYFLTIFNPKKKKEFSFFRPQCVFFSFFLPSSSFQNQICGVLTGKRALENDPAKFAQELQQTQFEELSSLFFFLPLFFPSGRGSLRPRKPLLNFKPSSRSIATSVLIGANGVALYYEGFSCRHDPS